MLCIIPARGGSKRIPGKNIKDFLGEPVIGYSIRAAIESGIFSEVMVSTDSEDIASVARRLGAQVPFMRSAKTSDDYATTADVVSEVLERYEAAGRRFDSFAVIYATAPFITAVTLQKGRELLLNGHAGAFTCVQYSYPIQRALIINGEGNVEMREPQYLNSRSQDLPECYHDAGQCYFCRVTAFRQSHTLWGPDTAPIILPEQEVQDIDTPVDWQLAEIKYRMLYGDTANKPKQSPTASLLADSPFRLVPYQELTPELSEKIRAGRNLPSIREMMVDTDEISPEKHQGFVKSLSGRDDKQYYAIFVNTDDEEPIGSLTLSRLDSHSVERGIWLFPSAQGYGYARAVLSRLYDELHNQGIERVYTRVRRNNTPSNSLEEFLGATPVPATEYDALPPGMKPVDSDMIYYICYL